MFSPLDHIVDLLDPAVGGVGEVRVAGLVKS
jgi:hypothetical protein